MKNKNYHKIYLLLFVIFILVLPACNKQSTFPLPTTKDYNFYIISDFGSGENAGNKLQVAHQMNLLFTKVAPRFIITSGDNFHYNAPSSVIDTVWKWNFEQFFKVDKIKNLNWYVTLGNHDYDGNPDAQLDYAKVHPEWIMPARYFTFVQKVNDSTSLRVVIMDTSPFLKSYHKRSPSKYFPDTNIQLHWADSVLATSHERWKIVIGHHPIYHAGWFPGNTEELVQQLNPLLKKYEVDFYFSGHVHTFQHNQIGKIDYVTTTSTLKSRMVTPWFYNRYHKTTTGFTLCSVDTHHFRFYFIDEKGTILYSYSRNK